MMCSQAKRSYALSLNNTRLDWDKHLSYFIVIFTLIGGFRWNVGADSYAYAQGFKYPDRTIDVFLENKEYLWYALLWLHKHMDLHYVFGMCSAAFLQIFFLTKTAKEYRYILLCFPIVLFGSKYFCDMMNGVRQLIAAAIFIYATRDIVNHKLIRYVAFIFIASMFHHSAIMLYPLYFLRYVPNRFYDIANYRVLCIGIYLLCFALGQTPQFGSYLHYFETIADFSDYESYSMQISETINGGMEDKFNFGLMQVSWLFTSLFTIVFAPQLKEEYQDKIPYFKLWYFFSYLYACLYFLVQNVGIALLRPIMYLEYFHLIIISLLLYFFYSQRSNTYYRYLFWGYVIVIWTSKIWDIMKGCAVYPNEITIYKLFFFHTIK